MRPSIATFALLALLTLSIGSCAPAPADAGPRKEAINPSGEPITTPYSPIVRTGNVLYLSGVIGRGEIEEATRQSLEGVRSRLEAVDGTMDDLVKCTVFMVDMADYSGMNEAYQEFFPSNPPARSAIAVRELPASASVEIECIAAAP